MGAGFGGEGLGGARVLKSGTRVNEGYGEPGYGGIGTNFNPIPN